MLRCIAVRRSTANRFSPEVSAVSVSALPSGLEALHRQQGAEAGGLLGACK